MEPELEMYFRIHTGGTVVTIGPDEDGLGLIKIEEDGRYLYLSKDVARLLVKAVTRLCEEDIYAN
jgi:hypothetical protein